MLVLQLAGDRAAFALANIARRRVVGEVGRVGFRTVAHEHHRVCQRDPRLRQPDHQRRVARRFDDRDNLRIGEPHVFARANHQPPHGRGEIAGLQQPRQIVQRRVGVGAAHAFLERRQNIVVLVAVLVIFHRALLRQRFGALERDRIGAVGFVCAEQAQFAGVHRFADVAAAGKRNIARHAFFAGDRDPFFFFKKPERPLHRRQNLFGGDALEFEDG